MLFPLAKDKLAAKLKNGGKRFKVLLKTQKINFFAPPLNFFAFLVVFYLPTAGTLFGTPCCMLFKSKKTRYFP